jgi:hypothetical protein
VDGRAGFPRDVWLTRNVVFTKDKSAGRVPAQDPNFEKRCWSVTHRRLVSWDILRCHVEGEQESVRTLELKSVLTLAIGFNLIRHHHESVHDGKKYKMLNCKKANGNVPYNVVFPSQFAHLLIQYQQHPESKSLAPDETPCGPDTKGLLKRAHVVAGEIRYVGKETDRKWEEGNDISILEFAATEYGRKGKIVASEDVKAKISSIGINKCARERTPRGPRKQTLSYAAVFFSLKIVCSFVARTMPSRIVAM